MIDLKFNFRFFKMVHGRSSNPPPQFDKRNYPIARNMAMSRHSLGLRSPRVTVEPCLQNSNVFLHRAYLLIKRPNLVKAVPILTGNSLPNSPDE